jgi:hypothetical protein
MDKCSTALKVLLGNPKRRQLRVLSLKIFDNNKNNNYKM